MVFALSSTMVPVPVSVLKIMLFISLEEDV